MLFAVAPSDLTIVWPSSVMVESSVPSYLPDYLPKRFQRIHLELTNQCNFSCIFCPNCIMTRKRGFMDEALARSAIDQIAELDITEKITFHVMGEPLLHPQFFQILDHARLKGMPVGLTTNGGLLKASTIKAIATRDLHQIDVSLQTPDKDSFLKTRGTRTDFEKYAQQILDLAAACHERRRMPIFKLRIMTTRFARKLRDELGIPNFLARSEHLQKVVIEWTERISARLGRPVPHQLAGKVKKIGVFGWNVIEILPNVFIETYVLTDWGNAFRSDKVVEAGHGYCFGMRDHFGILYSGDVVLCCIDYEGKTALGNIRDASVASILRSEKLKIIVEGFRKGRLVHPYCRKCLGSHSAFGSFVKPLVSYFGLKVFRPLLYKKYRLYE